MRLFNGIFSVYWFGLFVALWFGYQPSFLEISCGFLLAGLNFLKEVF